MADAPAAPDAAPPQLDYAPPPDRRRKWLRRSIIGLLLAFACAVVVLNGPWMIRRARLIYWQRQCLSYAAPADQVITDTDHDAARRLKGDGGFDYASGSWGATAARKPPRCLVEFDALTNGEAMSRSGHITFLHQRRSPDGTTWLVSVSLGDGSYDAAAFRLYHWTATRPARVDSLVVGTNTIMMIDTPLGGRYAPYRMYAGQADPVDESHFTIVKHYEGFAPQTWDGYVTNGGEVNLGARPLVMSATNPR